MHIDTIPRRVEAKAFENSIYTGTKYLFIYHDGIEGHNPWVQSNTNDGNYYDWIRNAFSVLWSKEQLDEFAPSRKVHEFLQSVNKTREEEAKKEAKLAKTAKPYPDKVDGKEVMVDPRPRHAERAEFLKNNVIIFVEVTFK